MKILVSIIPVLLLLGLMLWFDSFRLIHRWVLILCLLWGGVSASISLVTNTLIAGSLPVSFDMLSRYIAPFTEEVLKLALLLFLIARHRIGFAIDAAIYGFAVGTGFAFSENVVYLLQLEPGQTNLLTWVVRGFGTAVMHGGVTAVAAVILVRKPADHRILLQPFLLALVFSYIVHACYNAFLISPLVSALAITLLVPVIMILVFRSGERNLRMWMDVGMDTEVGLLLMINQGKFSDTRAGSYLLSVKDHFPREVVVDIYCFVALYVELSIKAKGLLMLKDNDLPLPMDPRITDKLSELDHLRKRIGKAGLLALRPILRMNRRDLWALSILKPE